MPTEPDAGWEIVRRRFRISGRVQGVGYRAYAARAARSLRLSGGASNLDDGSVEVVAEGPAHALERLESALSEGPRLARVDAVAVETLVRDEPSGPFDVEF
jgi:acylphosphatase